MAKFNESLELTRETAIEFLRLYGRAHQDNDYIGYYKSGRDFFDNMGNHTLSALLSQLPFKTKCRFCTNKCQKECFDSRCSSSIYSWLCDGK